MRRWVLRSRGGYLAASRAVDGPPIRLVANPLEAAGFPDEITATRRRAALTELGWRDIDVIEVAL